MNAVVWIIVVVGVALTFRAISPLRNPPMRKCHICGGDGEITVEFVFGIQQQDCPECDGDGWVLR